MNNNINKKFQNRIRELRNDMGVKQAVLANAIGIDPSVLSKLETNFRQPKRDHLIPLANFFQVSIDYLLGVSDDYVVVTYLVNSHKSTKYFLSNEEYKILRPNYIFYDGNDLRQFMKGGPSKLNQMRGVENIIGSDSVLKRFENKVFSKVIDELATLGDNEIDYILQTIKMIKNK